MVQVHCSAAFRPRPRACLACATCSHYCHHAPNPEPERRAVPIPDPGRSLLSSNIGEVLTMFFGVLLADQIGLSGAGAGVVLPLLATQILWINMVTDGPPALALGVDPADGGLMLQPPRPAGERVLTPMMWRGIVVVGLIMAAGTLFVLDASLPGGFVEGVGDLRYAQTMAFTTLMLFQLFNVFNARSDVKSAFLDLFTNRWLWSAVGLSLLLQVIVVHAPFLQRAFGTVGLSGGDWLFCTAVASSVLWLRELTKLPGRWRGTGAARRVAGGPGRGPVPTVRTSV